MTFFSEYNMLKARFGEKNVKFPSYNFILLAYFVKSFALNDDEYPLVNMSVPCFADL